MWKLFKKNIDDIIALLARILMSLIFLLVSVFYALHFSGTKILFLSIKGFPFPAFLLTMAIIILVVGSLSVMIGYKAKWGAGLLIFFMIPITFIYHTNLISIQTGIDLLKNISIIGGLFFAVRMEPGKYSVDNLLLHLGKKRRLKKSTSQHKVVNVDITQQESGETLETISNKIADKNTISGEEKPEG